MRRTIKDNGGQESQKKNMKCQATSQTPATKQDGQDGVIQQETDRFVMAFIDKAKQLTVENTKLNEDWRALAARRQELDEKGMELEEKHRELAAMKKVVDAMEVYADYLKAHSPPVLLDMEQVAKNVGMNSAEELEDYLEARRVITAIHQ